MTNYYSMKWPVTKKQLLSYICHSLYWRYQSKHYDLAMREIPTDSLRVLMKGIVMALAFSAPS